MTWKEKEGPNDNSFSFTSDMAAMFIIKIKIEIYMYSFYTEQQKTEQQSLTVHYYILENIKESLWMLVLAKEITINENVYELITLNQLLEYFLIMLN